MNWRFCVALVERRALDQCNGSMDEGNGCGTIQGADGYGDGAIWGYGDGVGGGWGYGCGYDNDSDGYDTDGDGSSSEEW